jgi:hypothetical protein
MSFGNITSVGYSAPPCRVQNKKTAMESANEREWMQIWRQLKALR